MGVDDVLDNDWPSWIGCLSGQELYILRNLLNYAHRRINWVKTYYPNFYDMPDDTDWDEIDAIVSGLEENLMDCTEYLELLQQAADNAISQISVGGPLQDGQDGYGAFPIDNETRDVLLEPDTEDACAIAQLWYQAGFEAITEHVLPITGFVFDYLLPGLGTLLVGLLEPTPIPELIGIYVIQEAIQELMQAGYDSSETNLYNWLVSNKDDLVCSLYNGCKANGQASAIWSDTYDEVVSPSSGISAGDKLMLNLFMGSWVGLVAALAWTEETDWAIANVDPDYCDSCPEEPIQGSNWFAIPLGGSEWRQTITVPSGSGWRHSCACFHFTQYSDRHLAALVFKTYPVTPTTETNTLKLMHPAECQCEPRPYAFNTNCSYELHPGIWCTYYPYGYNASEMLSTLCPDRDYDNYLGILWSQGSDIVASFWLETNQTYEYNQDVEILWAVWEGTMP